MENNQTLSVEGFKYKDITEWNENTTFQPDLDVKLSIKLEDGAIINTAGFKIRRGDSTEYHACVSSQAGCKFGCEMCVSGRNGFQRNLSAAEICTQVKSVAEEFGVPILDHVVMMGIGEPLDNYDEFTSALRRLNSQGYTHKLSFATVGIPDKLTRFADENIPIRMLWESIHAPNDQKRQEILPIAKKYSLESVLGAGLYFAKKTGAELRANYLLYKGFNDSEEDAVQLAALLESKQEFILQLSQPNDVPFKQYKYGDSVDIERFQGYLKKHGFQNRIIRFLAAGRPLKAGCGEFAFLPAGKA